MTEFNTNDNRLNERFARWQQLTIKQLSFTNNLFIGFTLGLLSFLLSQTSLIISPLCWEIIFYLSSLIVLCISLIIGIILVINRLIDFRETTQLIYYRKHQLRI